MSKEWESKKESFEVFDGREVNINFMPTFLKRASKIPVGKGIRVIQKLEPIPLFPHMLDLGFDYVVEKVAEREYHVYFYRERGEAGKEHKVNREISLEKEKTDDKGKDQNFYAKNREKPGVMVGAVKFDEGFLSLEQVNLIYKHLPADISFYDEEGFLRFFSKKNTSFFPKDRQDIGKEIKDCLPSKKLPGMYTMLDKFKAGKKDETDYWVNYRGHLLQIRYLAVRENKKNYKGMLEVIQDITEVQESTKGNKFIKWT